ncbi:MAG: carboxypeptidase-like regulatory domain-containing protein, partial [Chitinophagaceae bacterium]|nr:carboxypeptidase-like regulatory domain-containing protein [Chitinophagaceae bacterium]
MKGTMQYSVFLFFSLFITTSVFANDESIGIISGKIITSDGKPAADVSVSVKGTNKITLTDENGNFIFNRLANGNYEIEISLVGYETGSQSVLIENNKPVNLFFQLKISEKNLQEIIVESKNKKLAIGKITIADKDFPQSTG